MLALFDQHYRSDAFDSYGEKRLYIRKNSDEWKIVGEYFVAKEERVRVARKPEPAPSTLIRALLTRWEAAWEKQDLDAYMACYDASFRSRSMDWKAWKRHRRKLNQKQEVVRVGIQDLDIQVLGPAQAKAVFKQDYRADDYRDYGLKELLLIKRAGTWKIEKEEWRPLPGNAT